LVCVRVHVETRKAEYLDISTGEGAGKLSAEVAGTAYRTAIAPAASAISTVQHTHGVPYDPSLAAAGPASSQAEKLRSLVASLAVAPHVPKLGFAQALSDARGRVPTFAANASILPTRSWIGWLVISVTGQGRRHVWQWALACGSAKWASQFLGTFSCPPSLRILSQGPDHLHRAPLIAFVRTVVGTVGGPSQDPSWGPVQSSISPCGRQTQMWSYLQATPEMPNQELAFSPRLTLRRCR